MFTWSKRWCDRQQLWKAVITEDTVTRLIIPIRGHGKNHLKKARGKIWPKCNERRNNTHTQKKKKKKKKKTYQDEDKKSAINKNEFSYFAISQHLSIRTDFIRDVHLHG